MVNKSASLKAIKFIAKNLVLDFFYWPVWWYSTGLMESLKRFGFSIIRANQELALTVWIRNIFVPMFGDFTWQGRIISFLMRVVQIIGRGIMFVFLVLVALAGIVIWITVPIVVIYEILFNMNWWFL